MDAPDRPGRQRAAVATTADEQLLVVPVERRRRELAEPHVAEYGTQVALDVAGHLPGRLRREVRSGELEPPVQQLPDRRRRPGREATLGLDLHLVQHPLSFALAGPNGLRGRALPAGDRVGTQVDPELPRRPRWRIDPFRT
jgi:hypothetical protein